MSDIALTFAAAKRSLWPRVIWSSLATICFMGPIVWTLISPGAPDRVETPMAQDQPGQRLEILFPDSTEVGVNEHVLRMSLTSPAPREILQHPELRILFYLGEHKSAHTLTGRLEVAGTPCFYETAPNVGVSDGRLIAFVRRPARCRPGESRPTGELRLTVHLTGPGPLRVYTIVPPPELRARGMMYVDDRAHDHPDPSAVRGFFVDFWPDGGLKRVNLLAYVWTGSPRSDRFWTAIALIAALLFVGILAFPLTEQPDKAGEQRRRFAIVSVVGSFCIASSFSLAYALIVPPFQAADESDHFVGYGLIVNRPSIVPDALAWARVDHFYRIRFHADERFRPRDIGDPAPGGAAFDPPPTRARSSLTAQFWALTGHVAPVMSVKRLLVAGRVTYALLFGLAVATATALFVACTPARYPQLLSLLFLFAPTLAFFAMQFGEVSLLTSVYVVFSATLIVLFLDSDITHWMGLPLGVTSGAMLAGARNSIPMVVTVATVMAARVILGPRDKDRARFKALVFWGGLALGAGIFFLVLTPEHLGRIGNALVFVREHAPSPLTWIIVWSTDYSFVFAVAALGWILETEMAGLAAAVMRTIAPAAILAARLAAVMLPLAIAASIVGSLWWEYPTIPNIEGGVRPTLADYLANVAVTMTTMFRWEHHSLFLSTSFWAGFGWLDTVPDQAFISFLVVLTGMSMIGLSVHLARTRNVRQIVWLAIFVCGSALTLVCFAVAAYEHPANLHGRYLIGWFMSMLAVVWVTPALWENRLFESSPRVPRPAVFQCVWIGVHAFALCFILRRYF